MVEVQEIPVRPILLGLAYLVELRADGDSASAQFGPGSGSRSRAALMTSSGATVGHPPTRAAARPSLVPQALVGADDDELADELGEGGEHMDDEPAAGCPGSRGAR
ncbi:hypothetical protein ADK59_26190 [Streptomyces sp. XY332]|nr:hypothetical protein ADK59_26190 [Streptomyces sp. XY332]